MSLTGDANESSSNDMNVADNSGVMIFKDLGAQSCWSDICKSNSGLKSDLAQWHAMVVYMAGLHGHI